MSQANPSKDVESVRLEAIEDYPHDWPYASDNLMSNFDHEIDQTVAEELKRDKLIAEYPGWEFHATCWWDGARGKYLAAVRRYHALVATYAAGTPKELMDAICEDFGDG